MKISKMVWTKSPKFVIIFVAYYFYVYDENETEVNRKNSLHFSPVLPHQEKKCKLYSNKIFVAFRKATKSHSICWPFYVKLYALIFIQIASVCILISIFVTVSQINDFYWCYSSNNPTNNDCSVNCSSEWSHLCSGILNFCI